MMLLMSCVLSRVQKQVMFEIKMRDGSSIAEFLLIVQYMGTSLIRNRPPPPRASIGP